MQVKVQVDGVIRLSIGFIKLHRQLQDCWVWKDERFSRGQAWVDLLLLANHKDKKMLFEGEIITIHRGQLMTSYSILASRWKWSRQTVMRFLELLESDSMVNKTRNSNGTLLTIVKYDDFQCYDSKDGTLMEQGWNADGTSVDTNNNDNNIKNDKNVKNNYSVHFEEFWKCYPRRKEKANAYRCYQARLKDGYSEEELLTACKAYASECEKTHRDEKYIKLCATFIGCNTPFVDYLKGGDTDGRNNNNSVTEEARASAYSEYQKEYFSHYGITDL